MLYPLLFTPIYKNYIWGGRRIPLLFNRVYSEGPIAESWEISAQKEGMTLVENGPLKGLTLNQLLARDPHALMGKHMHLKEFPLLLKLIDARENLSIQVHPFQGKEAKNECWIILDAEKNSRIYAGFKTLFSKTEIMRQLGSADIVGLMQNVPVKKGEVFWIPGGRLHGIGAGCLIFEVQQTSNTTYRVYDWGRGRPCHLEEAKKILTCNDSQKAQIAPKHIEHCPNYTHIELIRTPFFIVEKWTLYKTQQWNKKKDQCELIFCLEGESSLVPFGRSCLIPAVCPSPTIVTKGCSFLRIFLP